MTDASKRQQKQELLEQFASQARQLFAENDTPAPGWLDTELNNARLVSTSLYHGRLQEFRDLLAECDGDLPCFYNAATKLAEST